MKLIAYNVRDDEIPFIKQWGAENEIEVGYNTQILDSKTIEKAKGFDGISCLQTIPYSAELFNKFSKLDIKSLSLRNVGIDNIDLEAAKQNGIEITNVPAYSPESIAEFAVFMAMFLLRKAGYMYQQLHVDHQFHFSSDFMGRLIEDQTVGVIGTGRIGRHVIQLFQGLGAKVIAFDKFPMKNPFFEYVDNEEDIFERADIVTLHMPATADNDHLVNKEIFKMMKDDALLINTARGSIVDTADLIWALENKEIAGAGIDTIENESADLQDSRSTKLVTDKNVLKLANMPNVIVTPHSAFHTATAVKNMVDISLNNLKNMVDGGTPDDLVD